MRTTSPRRPTGRRVGIALLSAALLTLPGCSAKSAPAPNSSTATSQASPSTTPGTSSNTKRPSGLRWDSGVVGHRQAESAAFATRRGHALDVIGVSPTRDSWKALLGTWWLEPGVIPADFTGTLNVAMPLFPDDGTMAQAAAGAYDAQWRQFATTLAKRYPTAYVRPGWEMNIPNWKWSANPDNVEQYKQAFRRASRAMKSAAPGLRIVFNPNEGRGGTLPDASLAWPGDDVVDVVGLDAYDWHPAYDAKGWQTHKTQDQGWDYWGRFARQHGKRFAVPEWGVIPGNESSGGDNPAYVDAVYGWMQANADIMAFESYFDETSDYCRCALSLNPQAQQAYVAWMPKLTQK